ncbi:hypothetical protein NL108_007916 [Boleophthalmus pectinirostris]|nr:hypothetical protein NL108_007916 [Boleophthalmus pectinirostris]
MNKIVKERKKKIKFYCINTLFRILVCPTLLYNVIIYFYAMFYRYCVFLYMCLFYVIVICCSLLSTYTDKSLKLGLQLFLIYILLLLLLIIIFLQVVTTIQTRTRKNIHFD